MPLYTLNNAKADASGQTLFYNNHTKYEMIQIFHDGLVYFVIKKGIINNTCIKYKNSKREKQRRGKNGEERNNIIHAIKTDQTALRTVISHPLDNRTASSRVSPQELQITHGYLGQIRQSVF